MFCTCCTAVLRSLGPSSTMHAASVGKLFHTYTHTHRCKTMHAASVGKLFHTYTHTEMCLSRTKRWTHGWRAFLTSERVFRHELLWDCLFGRKFYCDNEIQPKVWAESRCRSEHDFSSRAQVTCQQTVFDLESIWATDIMLNRTRKVQPVNRLSCGAKLQRWALGWGSKGHQNANPAFSRTFSTH